MGRFLQPDHSRGDADTIGGYMAVHARPAAFEGADGASYSVAIEIDRTGEEGARTWGAFFLFLRWRPVGATGVERHLESEFLAWGDAAASARDALGRMSLTETREVLDGCVRSAATTSDRRWWEAMRDDT